MANNSKKLYFVKGLNEDKSKYDLIITNNISLELKKIYFFKLIKERYNSVVEDDVIINFLKHLNVDGKLEYKNRGLYILWLILNQFSDYFNKTSQLNNKQFIDKLNEGIKYELSYIQLKQQYAKEFNINFELPYADFLEALYKINQDKSDILLNAYDKYIDVLSYLVDNINVIIDIIIENSDILDYLLSVNAIKINLQKKLNKHKIEIYLSNSDLINIDITQLQ